MKLTQLISINAVLAMGFGIAFALYGPLMIAFFGVPEIPEDNIILYWMVASFARMFGGILLGFGLVLLSLRSLLRSPGVPPSAQRGLAFALLIAHGLGALIALVQQFAIWDSPAGWVAFALFALMFAGYVYILVAVPVEKPLLTI
jgi:hypothetical protein